MRLTVDPPFSEGSPPGGSAIVPHAKCLSGPIRQTPPRYVAISALRTTLPLPLPLPLGLGPGLHGPWPPPAPWTKLPGDGVFDIAMALKRTILITGCSDGSLGCALALAFHRANWRVLASGRNLSKLKQVESAGMETVQLDTTSDESIVNAVSRVRDLTGGSLDVLLNNAGAGYSMPLMDLEIARARQLFDLNVFSIIAVTRAFFPLLTQSAPGGIVVNNTACSSVTTGALPFAGAYNASKAAAASLTEVLRLELAPFGIKVINLMTGSVRSTFHDNAPQATLPPTSLYNVAKETVERAMSGQEAAATGADPAKWADQVVSDLGKSNPPHWLWRGKYSTLVRLASFLPVGFLDGSIKSKVGLDVVERKIREQGGSSKIKPA
ncbi:hypothetical protein XA68_14402 [Ophiocordyceps unilateralis]|uniref:Uncharacterized protein n=1 Tax=Ophiocordyceps unilateralis TaxID=268505 RepID=A0A2A9PMI5_OPHUN|nr:hypothetical protein XA68_14402 [Ophiocordyceps unilateralis]